MWTTPYGLQLQFDWRADGDNSRGMKLYIHLKDKLAVKKKKRWSQIMYMSYILDYAAYYKPLGMESEVIKNEHIRPGIGDSQDNSLRLHAEKPWRGTTGGEQEITIELGETAVSVTGIILQAGVKGERVEKIKVNEGEEIEVPWSTTPPSTPHANSTVTCLLEPSILTKELTVTLLDWTGKDDTPPQQPCLRMEILGHIDASNKPLGMENGDIKDKQIKATPKCCEDNSLRLGATKPWKGNIASSNSEQKISIDLKEKSLVTGIILQAAGENEGRVTKIRVANQVDDDIDRDTYILATDADVKFTPKSANKLLDRAQWDTDVGAVCGRTHCLGNGAMFWLQLFDYAVGHWFQKAANSTFGTVLCCPGCFSVYRCSAIRKCVSTYATKAEKAEDFLMKDMGEDRWLCTLMIERGYRLVYTSIAENSTFVPVSFNDFFNQRRRWGPSTIANQVELMRKWCKVVRNPHVSHLFLLYQTLLFLSFLIGPATAILIAAGGLDFYVSGSFPLEATIAIMSILTFMFGYVCLKCKQETQLKWAKALGAMFGVVMIMTTVALVEKIVITIRTITGSSEGVSPVEVLTQLDTYYFIATIGMFLVAGLIHFRESYCLLHGVLYFFALPTTFIFLNIYGICNITDKSWGTREGKTTDGVKESNKNLFDTIGQKFRNVLGNVQESGGGASFDTEDGRAQNVAAGRNGEATHGRAENSPLLTIKEEKDPGQEESIGGANADTEDGRAQKAADTRNDGAIRRRKNTQMVDPGIKIQNWLQEVVFNGDEYLTVRLSLVLQIMTNRFGTYVVLPHAL
ncbi:PREDICTED: chitin synthase 1-like [Branchiostoma belcheri]|uniref:chitin synthase n=1 Tax=Branchiostoma belcheri TaxID=7741 RepID=A0A6P4YWJ6_BRABE|nr:PREDICTED: chitin synthase 1-like [Branchiostoma belcheri]